MTYTQFLMIIELANISEQAKTCLLNLSHDDFNTLVYDNYGIMLNCSDAVNFFYTIIQF